jgi:hypothetical protein
MSNGPTIFDQGLLTSIMKLIPTWHAVIVDQNMLINNYLFNVFVTGGTNFAPGSSPNFRISSFCKY